MTSPQNPQNIPDTPPNDGNAATAGQSPYGPLASEAAPQGGQSFPRPGTTPNGVAPQNSSFPGQYTGTGQRPSTPAGPASIPGGFNPAQQQGPGGFVPGQQQGPGGFNPAQQQGPGGFNPAQQQGPSSLNPTSQGSVNGFNPTGANPAGFTPNTNNTSFPAGPNPNPQQPGFAPQQSQAQQYAQQLQQGIQNAANTIGPAAQNAMQNATATLQANGLAQGKDWRSWLPIAVVVSAVLTLIGFFLPVAKSSYLDVDLGWWASNTGDAEQFDSSSDATFLVIGFLVAIGLVGASLFTAKRKLFVSGSYVALIAGLFGVFTVGRITAFTTLFSAIPLAKVETGAGPTVVGIFSFTTMLLAAIALHMSDLGKDGTSASGTATPNAPLADAATTGAPSSPVVGAAPAPAAGNPAPGNSFPTNLHGSGPLANSGSNTGNAFPAAPNGNNGFPGASHAGNGFSTNANGTQTASTGPTTDPTSPVAKTEPASTDSADDQH